MALRYDEDLDCDLAADIRNIAEASAMLQQKGVELCVQLTPSLFEDDLPPPDVLAQLAPVIQRINCSKLKTARRLSEAFKKKPCFSAAHILALSNAGTSLQELCISDHNVDNRDDIMSDASMASIATFSCLTRLDPVCCGSPALQALGQLSHLQKLGLRLRHEGLARETCCEAVLLSNNAGLRKVYLDGYAWSNATYLALLTLTRLEVLTLAVSTISSPSAYVLGDVVATRCISIWFQESESIADCVPQEITSSCANITSLRLDYMSAAKLQHVCTMEHLSSLMIFRPNSFTGFELVTQPNMSRLDLVNCHDLHTEGLRHIVHIFPDLTRIGMVSGPLAPWPKVCVDSFVEISQLRRLELVDLSGPGLGRGLGNITVDQAEALECAIRAQQELGLLQPGVRLRLSKMMPHHNDIHFQIRISSSYHQVLRGTAPGGRLERAIERYWVQQLAATCQVERATAGAKLMLCCFMTAIYVKVAPRFVAMLSRWW